MARIIALANQKGGVAKTTTASSMALALTKLGFKVLVIDLDEQFSLTHTLGIKNPKRTIYDLLVNDASVKNVLQSVNGLDVIPSSIEMAKLERYLTEPGKESRLREILAPIRRQWDYIVLDTPPSLSLATILALACADDVIIPTGAEVLAVRGIGQFFNTFSTVRAALNRDAQLTGILLTRYSDRTNNAKELTGIIEEIAEKIGTKIFDTRIRSSIKIAEAQFEQVNPFEAYPSNAAVIDYMNFTKEYLGGQTNG